MGIEIEADHRRRVAIVDAPEAIDEATDEAINFAARPVLDRLIAMRARCFDPRGLYTRLFHSDDPRDIARAKAICARCTVSEACLGRAIERAEPCGVWGGELLVDGLVASFPRRRGRRPKVRASVQVDEITGLAYEPVVSAV